MITLKVANGTELSKRLAMLAAPIQPRVLRAALRAGAEPIRANAAALAPREPGAPDLADNIVISAASGEFEGDVAVAVGPARKFFYGSFQEFGTARHGAQPFMRPAFDNQLQTSLRIIGEHLMAAIRKQLPETFSGKGGFLK